MSDLSVSPLVLSFHRCFIQYYSPARISISVYLSTDIHNSMSKLDKNCTRARIAIRLTKWQFRRFWWFSWNMLRCRWSRRTKCLSTGGRKCSLQKFAILIWRRQHENEFPYNAKFVYLIRVIQKCSAASDRSFSSGGRVIQKRRTYLRPRATDITFLNSSLRKYRAFHNVLRDYKHL